MKKSRFNLFLLGLATLAIFACDTNKDIRVHNIDEFNAAIANASPGDKIVLSNGTWENVELLAQANGEPENPIIITAEEKGKVLITGQSNLRIAGEYIEVSGLVFKDGYTPGSEVISFREKKEVYANHCRVTECVIDNFNNLERFSNETWIALYGKNNRVDHCILTGKRTSGVTITVRLIDEQCRNNNHIIDRNYIGYRQNLGSNGGETIRIGTSHYSLTNSGTKVEANYFDRCNGEHEIISNKSCGNVFINNTFYECRGTLTFRHGHDNLAEGNFFLGNFKDNTGGIRIINERNKAINNYFYGLTGYRFRGALVIMNGVPKSPINRYNQVIEGVFSDNTFINCDHIQLCAGKDEERSLPPVGSIIQNNIFYSDSAKQMFTIYDDITGIEFRNNYGSLGLSGLPSSKINLTSIRLIKNNAGFWIPQSDSIKNAGCSMEEPMAKKENTGVEWYKVSEEELLFETGNQIIVKPGLNTLAEAVRKAEKGDVLVLDSGEYMNTKDIPVKHPISIKASSAGRSIVYTEKPTLFILENEGSLKLSGLILSGAQSPDQPGNSLLSTSKYAMNRNYKVMIESCHIEDLDVNHSFDFFKIYPHTFADTFLLRNCTFKDISGHIARLNVEKDDLGIYNAENIIYLNCRFQNIGGSILEAYRGGTDESTFGPILLMDSVYVMQSGLDMRNQSGASLSLHGVQNARISNSSFNRSAPFRLFLTNGDPVCTISNLNLFPKAEIESNSPNYNISNLSHKDL